MNPTGCDCGGYCTGTCQAAAREHVPARCELCGKTGELFAFVDWNGAVRMELCEACAEKDVGVIYEMDDATPVETIEGETTPVPAMSMSDLVFGQAQRGESLPFCVCGRRLTECDGSRAKCWSRPSRAVRS